MLKMDSEDLYIFDPEKNVKYKLIVSKENFLRAQTDEQFLSTLLFHAKCTSVPIPIMEKNSEAVECDDGVICGDDTENLQSTSFQSLHEAENVPITKNISVWSYLQTKSLIKSMAVHYKDVNNPRKRKQVFENIANDMISEGFTIDSTAVSNKWKSLTRSYSKCKDTKARTGQGPSRFLFFEDLDEILGNKPTNECTHSLNSTFDYQNEASTSIVDETSSTGNGTDGQESDVVRPLELQKQNVITQRPINKRKYLSLKTEYIQKKLKEYYERKDRHNERLAIEERKLEIENQKMELLRAYLSTK